MDFLLSLCPPPICSHHSFAQSPHLRGKVRDYQCPAGLYSPVTAASHPDALTSSHSLPGSSQSNHASLLAALLICQALFSLSPCRTCNAPSYCRACCLASRRCLFNAIYPWRPSLTSSDEADHCHQSLSLLFPSISLHNIYHHAICHIFVVRLPRYIPTH